MNHPIPETDRPCHPTGRHLGCWNPSADGSRIFPLREALLQPGMPLAVVHDGTGVSARTCGSFRLGEPAADGALPLLAFVPPVLPEDLGATLFLREHGIRYPYVAGSMAKGISSAAMVEAMGHAGMLGFFGAAGLPPTEVDDAIHRIRSGLSEHSFGMNLIHSPQEPDLESALVELYLKRGVTLVEASAFLDLTLPLVRYRVAGIRRGPDGEVVTPNRIVGKVSREEVAARFFAPPPEKFLRELIASRQITHEEAELAATIPVAHDVTAEADSGGHTDNRPAVALFPTIRSLKDRMQDQYRYRRPLLVGLGGGIGTPQAAAAAFAMGAAYIVTGSVNQACIESGSCDTVRELLAETRQADVIMAPAADMFEMGVTVQVLKRGTMFAMRAAKLYELYRSCAGLDAIPAPEREKLEKTIFQSPLETVWRDTRAYFMSRDPRQVERAERDPKHLMALVFRWYLGKAAHWAKDGEPSRRMDYQVWCGPAMGAFNEWTAGSFMADAGNRRVDNVAMNLLYGAAVVQRQSILQCQGVPLSPEETRIVPLESEKIKEYLK